MLYVSFTEMVEISFFLSGWNIQDWKKTYSSSGSLDFGFVTLLAAVMTLYVGL